MMNQLLDRDVKTHVTILGWVYIVSHGLFLLLALFLFVLFIGIGALSGDAEAAPILFLVAAFIGGIMALLALPGVLAGIGLLAGKSWGRYLGTVVAILNLFNVPIGTVIGIYGLWVLFQEATERYFASGLPPAAQPPA